jgi:hypothetical protein
MIVKYPDGRQEALGELRKLLSGETGRTKSRIQKEIDDIADGEKGEKDTAYHLNAAYGSSMSHMLVHDLVLEHEDISVQMDHLVITGHRKIFVVETKAIKGTLKIDEDGACTAVYESGKRFQMASPLDQVRRHAIVLRNWLVANNSSMREVIPIVAVSPRTKVNNASDIRDVHIVQADRLPRIIQEMDETDNDRYVVTKSQHACPEEVAGAAWFLARAHKPRKVDWRNRLGLAPGSNYSNQSQMFGDLPDQTIIKTSRQALDDQIKQDAEEVKKAKAKDVEIYRGRIQSYHGKNNRISFKWSSGEDQNRFNDECRAKGGIYHTRGFWTLPEDKAEEVLLSLKKAPPRQEDMFEPIDITIPDLLEDEHKKANPQIIRIETPYGCVMAVRDALGFARIPFDTIDPALVAHVRAVCTGRARLDVALNEWLVEAEKVSEVFESLRHKTVRMVG